MRPNPSLHPASRFLLLATALTAVLLLAAPEAGAVRRRAAPVNEAPGFQLFASPQSDPIVVGPNGDFVFVAATTSDRVDAINTSTHTVVGTVNVGIEPVSLAVKPGGTELWVSNHVSDSVSVVDIDLSSPNFMTVIETVQDIDANGVTQFDEPVGIAFKEDGTQAYVALSSRDDVAIVDTSTYQVTGRVHITAQDPRALAVRNNRLYVLAFESGNKTELSSCESLSQDTHCTMDINTLVAFIQNPNMPNVSGKNIATDTGASFPDRDLFVYNLGTGLANGASPTDTVSGVGTLLYGMVVGNSNGHVYVTQTDARNGVNGLDGQNLIDLQDRMFLNQITDVTCTGGGSNPCSTVTRNDLEEPPGTNVTLPLATPYGVAIDANDRLLVATAAASSRIFSWDILGGSGPGKVKAHLDVGAIPRGIALDASGTAWVLNTLGNTVSVVSVDTNPASPSFGALGLVDTIPVGADPTPDAVRLGRIAFENANASSSGTFACGSCHPDGNTDQLLWRIGGSCVGCSGDEPRSTMPIRGLRDSEPLHWDGSLGDPFGLGNGSDPTASFPPSQTAAGQVCNVDTNPHACFRQLVEASLAGVMCDQNGGCPVGPSGDAGPLTDTERANMATFLERVSYPPARSRPIDDLVSTTALNGFRDFFMDDPDGRGGTSVSNGLVSNPQTCADTDAGCHEFPLGTSSNSETLAAFDAPTMRGMTDRFLQFSNGITGTEEMLLGFNDGFSIDLDGPGGLPAIQSISQPFGTWSDATGFDERFTFGVAYGLFDLVYGGGAPEIFQMFEEASTGSSGALGKQVTLNPGTVGSGEANAMLAELELADTRGLVNLRGNGRLNGNAVVISFLQATNNYQVGAGTQTRSQLLTNAQSGALLATLTAYPRAGVTESTPQPLLSVPGGNGAGGFLDPNALLCGTGDAPVTPNTTGLPNDPLLPVITASNTVMQLETKYISASDVVFVDGAPYPGATIAVVGHTPKCGGSVTPDQVNLDLGSKPPNGTHLLQVRSAGGLLSDELPFVVQ